MSFIPLQIIDQHHRKHDYLRISLTERCNLRCFYCMPPEGVELTPQQHLMSAEELIAIAREFVSMGVKKIRLTGGEPLVRKDAPEILEELGKLPVELAMTSNGIIVDRFINQMKRIGLKKINISLDSLKKERFQRITRRDFFDRVMRNIDLLHSEGFDVKINAVLIKGYNDDEIVDFIQMGQYRKLDIRFIEYMPFDGNSWDWSKGVSLDEIQQVAYDNFATIHEFETEKAATAKSFQVKGFEGTYGIISSVTNPFCDTCNRIRLTADGKIKNCLFSSGETDLLQTYRQGKDIRPLIVQNIKQKEASRGGMDSWEEFNDTARHAQNRSMIRIGG